MNNENKYQLKFKQIGINLLDTLNFTQKHAIVFKKHKHNLFEQL